MKSILLWWALAAPLVGILLLVGFGQGAGHLLFGSGSSLTPELPIVRLILAYGAGGILSGLVLQALWRPQGGPWNAAAVGFVAAIPFFLAIRVAVLGPFGWGTDQILGLGLRAVFGIVVGLVLWRVHSGHDTPANGFPDLGPRSR